MAKEKMTKGDAVWYIVNDSWELCNKPHRFFNSLRKVIDKFHKNNEAMNALCLSGTKEETLKQIDRLETAFREKYYD